MTRSPPGIFGATDRGEEQVALEQLAAERGSSTSATASPPAIGGRSLGRCHAAAQHEPGQQRLRPRPPETTAPNAPAAARPSAASAVRLSGVGCCRAGGGAPRPRSASLASAAHERSGDTRRRPVRTAAPAAVDPSAPRPAARRAAVARPSTTRRHEELEPGQRPLPERPPRDGVDHHRAEHADEPDRRRPARRSTPARPSAASPCAARRRRRVGRRRSREEPERQRSRGSATRCRSPITARNAYSGRPRWQQRSRPAPSSPSASATIALERTDAAATLPEHRARRAPGRRRTRRPTAGSAPA